MEKDCSLYDKLKQLDESDQYPFHMPGHKRNDKAGIPGRMAHFDITEIEGFDNLHHAEGILKDAMDRAAKLYRSEETHFLVNGSSCGILTAISAVVTEGETIVLCRNAHTSAYHGAFLRGAKVKSLYPELPDGHGLYGIITPEAVRQALCETPEAKAVMITSPTYDGFISDIRKIVEIVHSYDKILIVDEAHGAHFGLDHRMPESSITCGADLVIQSLHKTLPALTQTALLHVNGSRVDREKVKRFLRIYQTSSPSYVLMGSIDHCIRQMEQNSKNWFDSFFANRKEFMESVRGLQYLQVIDEAFCFRNGMKQPDSGKLVILTGSSGYTGAQLQSMLSEQYHLQMEMAGLTYVVAIVTVMDEREGFLRLSRALHEIDRKCAEQAEGAESGEKKDCSGHMPAQEDIGFQLFQEVMEERKRQSAEMTIKQAMEAEEKKLQTIPLSLSSGKIVAEFIYLYPPGIPVILPGERMTDRVVQLIQTYIENHLNVQGLSDWTGATVRCFK